MICFTNAYSKGKQLRRAKRNSEISHGIYSKGQELKRDPEVALETVAHPPSEEKLEEDEEL